MTTVELGEREPVVRVMEVDRGESVADELHPLQRVIGLGDDLTQLAIVDVDGDRRGRVVRRGR